VVGNYWPSDSSGSAAAPTAVGFTSRGAGGSSASGSGSAGPAEGKAGSFGSRPWPPKGDLESSSSRV